MKSVKEIQKLLNSWQTGPRKKLGQNFLISQKVVGQIIAYVKEQEFEKIIEIGPGLGAVTEDLILLGRPLELIELDKYFCEYWQSKDISIRNIDALKLDWQKEFREDYILVSNLPYQISSSIVIDRSVLSENCKNMVLMFQKEVAQRIQAPHGGKDYGLLSVIAQCFWNIDKLVEAGPRDFYPAPKVASRVLTFIRKDNPIDLKEAYRFLRFTKFCFDQRRKKLISRLNKNYKDIDWCKGFEQLSLPEEARPEALSPDHYISLFKIIEGTIGSS